MKGYQAKCPNMVKNPFTENSPDIVCGCGGFVIIKRGVFTQDSGYDPLGLKVQCKRCGGEYYLFPQVNAKEISV